MLDHLQWESLESRRTMAQLTMMYKIVNNLVDVPAEQYLALVSSRTFPTQGVVGCGEGVVYLMSPGHPSDIGL